VSVVPSHKALLNGWFDEQIVPLYSRSEELRRASLRRKIGALRESVISALEMQLERSTKSVGRAPGQARATEARLRRATALVEETRSARESEIERMTQDLPEAFSEMSSRLIGVWSDNRGGANSSDGIINALLLQFVQRRVEKLQHSLQTLACQFRDDLRTSAEELNITDVPTDDEFQSLVRGMPVFDPGPLNAPISRPTLSLFLGKRLAEKRLARRLYVEFGATANQSLDIYSGVLKEWVRFVTHEFDRRFETYAERYRAHAERSVGGKELSADEISAIAENLRALAVSQTNDIVETPTYSPRGNEPHTDSREIAGHAQKGEPC
jgi:hypothetical protein